MPSKKKTGEVPNGQGKRDSDQILREEFQISINSEGQAVPPLMTSFSMMCSKYDVPKELVEHLNTLNIETPTPVQMQVIPCMLEGFEVIGCAPTGSGKTLAFGLPLLHSMSQIVEHTGIRALIISPTRELANQTYEVLKSWKSVRVTALSDRSSKKKQEKGEGNELTVPQESGVVEKREGEQGTEGLAYNDHDIVVTTPMRLISLIKSGVLSVDQ